MFNRGFKITRVLNNNVVMILDDGGHEIVAFGNGIGFHYHAGECLPRKEAAKTYVNLDSTYKRRLVELLNEVPFECVEAAQAIIDYAEQKLSAKLATSILVNLADHINFTLTRYRDGSLAIPIAVSEEIKQFYPDEYRVGKHAVEMLNGRFDVRLDEGEASAIAFHILNALYKNDGRQTRKIIQSVDDLSRLICGDLGIERDQESLVYSRLIIHLKFFIRQIVQADSRNTSLGDDEAKRMLGEFVRRHTEIAATLASISAYMQEHYGYDMTGEELLYLALHLARLLENG